MKQFVFVVCSYFIDKKTKELFLAEAEYEYHGKFVDRNNAERW